MIKLIKIGDFWYTEYKGRIYSRATLVEDINQWSRVNSIPKILFRQLKKEFPDALKEFQIAPSNLEYSAGGRKVRQSPVTEVLMDNTVGADKYVTYHATVVMRAKTTLAKKNVAAKKVPSKAAKKATPRK
ncbi:MAG: hypothetical protein EON54_00330 [Alcaligenaceae bacterium]|nr:MAG: hypothetical protein EON54_00330 [Alcaligenaceae bacterium]